MRRNSLVGGTSSSPLGASIHDHCFFGPSGALTASGDVTLKSPAWRERMFAERAGSPAQGGAQAFFGTIGRRIARPSTCHPGHDGRRQRRAEPAARADGRHRRAARYAADAHQPHEHHPRRAVRRPASHRQGRAAAPARAPCRRTTSTSSARRNVPLDVLDPALTRPGRIGRHIRFRTPIKHDRLDIFDHYLAKVTHDPSLDTAKARDELARITNGYSPAMIEQVCSMALDVRPPRGAARNSAGTTSSRR